MCILSIEADIKYAAFLKKSLEEWSFQTIIALEGQVALDMLALHNIQLIILNAHLPDIDSYELCRQLKRINSNIPLIMLDKEDSLESKLSSFDAGADDFLVIPFEFSELLARIQVHRKRQTNSDALAPVSQLRVADLVLDLRKRTVSRAGRLIDITARELALLEYFLRHRGKTLSRGEIAEKVWDTPKGMHTNLIDVYVHALRKKIDKNFSRKLIHTRVGMGYIMVEE